VTSPPTIAIAFPGDSRRPGQWSGIPSGLASGLEAHGVQVAHVSAALRGPGRVVGRLPHRHAATLRSLRARLELRASHPDAVVQIGSEFTLPPTPRLATLEDMTVVQHVRLGDEWTATRSPRDIDAWIARQGLAYRRASVCCVATAWAKGSLVDDYGVPPDKVEVVGLGRNHDPPAGARDWETPRFLFIGRDWRRKNAPAVGRAFTRLRAERPAATLDVVGERPPLEGPGITVHGPLSLDVPAERARVEELYARATCFVMPSHREAFGIVYAEAGAAGMPSIGTTVGGAREVIGDGGRVVDPDDDDALLAAMRTLADPATAQRLGARARAHAERFTWPAVAGRVLAALGLDASARAA
jgi:glycogen synthase